MIQNIVVNFEDNKVNCYDTDKSYTLEMYKELIAFKITLESFYSKPKKGQTKIGVNLAVFQLTEDQYGKGSEKRIILNPGTENFKMVKIADITGDIDTIISIANSKTEEIKNK